MNQNRHNASDAFDFAPQVEKKVLLELLSQPRWNMEDATVYLNFVKAAWALTALPVYKASLGSPLQEPKQSLVGPSAAEGQTFPWLDPRISSAPSLSREQKIELEGVLHNLREPAELDRLRGIILKSVPNLSTTESLELEFDVLPPAVLTEMYEIFVLLPAYNQSKQASYIFHSA